LKDDIKKYGTGGFDVTTGMKKNVAYIEDRNGQMKELEKEKRASKEAGPVGGTRAESGSRAGVVPLTAQKT